MGAWRDAPFGETPQVGAYSRFSAFPNVTNFRKVGKFAVSIERPAYRVDPLTRGSALDPAGGSVLRHPV